MAIYRLLQNSPLGPEEIAILTDAYERTLRALSLVDRNDPITEMVAKKIIELGQRGIREAKELSAVAIKELGVNESQTAETQDQLLYCPACSSVLQLTDEFLDPKQGKTIRLFKCKRCGERIWDE